MTKREIIQLVDETTTPQIKAGEHHRFNDIWLVVAEDRIFCRQYSFGKKSWYTAFLEDPNGYIKCGETIVKVNGIIPDDLDTINPSINASYIEKYANRLNHYPDIAHKMTGEQFMAATLELVLV